MRTNSFASRVWLDSATQESLFSAELDYYRTHNQYPVELFGRRIVNIYRNINVQLVIVDACNAACGFCIEHAGEPRRVGRDHVNLFGRVLAQYASQRIVPHVSITGGEPTLRPDLVRAALNLCSAMDISRVNINTNGHNVDFLRKFPSVRVNISRHSHVAPESVFKICIPTPYLRGQTTYQCVLLRSHISSVNDMCAYMDWFLEQTPDVNFSFRGLSTLDPTKSYGCEHTFSQNEYVDAFALANAVASDPRFTFVEQKIGDHYWFELYRYRGRMVRLTYSNFAFLRTVEVAERSAGDWFSRATIITPDAHLYAGWTYDVNQIL